MLKPIKNLHIRWYVCIFVKNKQKVHVIILDKKFVENIKDVIMNAEFNGIFIYPRHPLHIGDISWGYSNLTKRFCRWIIIGSFS